MARTPSAAAALLNEHRRHVVADAAESGVCAVFGSGVHEDARLRATIAAALAGHTPARLRELARMPPDALADLFYRELDARIRAADAADEAGE